MNDENKKIFNQLKDQLSVIDPVAFVEKYLTLEGDPFRLSNNGYKPFADIYRYIGIKALEQDSKPVIMVKGRQVGGTTMACALEMYFMGSGLFGTGSKPPIRVIHAFPLLELAAAYSKTKFSQMMKTSFVNKSIVNKSGKIKSYMQSLLDSTSPTNDSLHFKQFIGGNHLWIESTGIDADRLMGRMLALDTEIPTPDGFVKLIDLKQGDRLFDENGNICNITKLHPIDLKPESYQITFDDGTKVEACADHLWMTYVSEYGKIKTTKDIFNSINNSHYIPLAKPINYSKKQLVIDPYLLGIKLGGNEFDLLNDKCISDNYLYSSIDQRFELLRGLVSNFNKNEFVSNFPTLRKQVLQLILSLGMSASLKGDKITFSISKGRQIVNVKSIPSVAMRCVTVDSPSNLFLITKSFISTHNTADVILFDECFPYEQRLVTNSGSVPIGSLYKNFISNEELPLVLSFNEKLEKFEYKPIGHVFKREKRDLIKIKCSGRKIKCTSEHPFLTSNGWKKADDLHKGSLLKSYFNKKGFVKAINDDQLQVILGSFLGDGCIQKSDESRYRLSVTHSMKQKNYCEWKSSLFDSNITTIEHNGYAQKPARRFTTKLFGLNKKIPKIKTYCPQWILDDIDVKGIAIWVMDDGSITRKWNGGCSMTISTCSFDKDSQKRFVEKFKSLGVECHYKKYLGYYYLLFNKDGTKKLFDIISPYIHDSMRYKINFLEKNSSYIWDSNYKSYGWLVVDSINNVDDKKVVYDLEVSDNYNFVLASNDRHAKKLSGPIVHNCQRTTGLAIGNALKILTAAKYGKISKGVQVYFGTPRTKGSDFYKMWMSSSQQYYHLGCESCKKHFPLYTPGSDDWKDIWIYGYIVKCPHCGFEQNKLEAAERGKWVALKNHNDPDCKMIGFHINQLYMPKFQREDIDNEMPGKHPINTERIFHTEVLGEFFQGDSSPITPEQIAEHCGDIGRKFKSRVSPGDEQMMLLGVDYGKRGDIEQLANPEKAIARGQSYSTAVVLSVKGPGLLSIEFAAKFKRNDFESKKSFLDQILRQYSIDLAVGDIGFSQDFSEMMHKSHGDRYIVSRAHPKVNRYVKYNDEAFPKEIVFERDYYIREMYEQMKKGQIRFPFGDYEKIAWLIEHCASMEMKASISKTGADPTVHYVKGSTPNDGFMALLNAYLAYKFLLTNGFSNLNPLLQDGNLKNINKPLVMGGYISRNM